MLLVLQQKSMLREQVDVNVQQRPSNVGVFERGRLHAGFAADNMQHTLERQ